MTVEKPDPPEGDAATAASSRSVDVDLTRDEPTAGADAPEAERTDLADTHRRNADRSDAADAQDAGTQADDVQADGAPVDGVQVDGAGSDDAPIDDAQLDDGRRDGAQLEGASVEDLDRGRDESRPTQAGSVWTEVDESRSRRAVLRALSALGIAVLAAVVLGLLIVAFSKAVGGDDTASKSTPPALTIPSGGGAAPSSVIPNDWVEQTSVGGIVFRAPPTWTSRQDSGVDLRVEPAAGGSGASFVGVGLVQGGTDPEAAATGFLTSTYSGQPRYVAQPATDDVSPRGERGRQVIATYSRSGTPVAVVVRAFPTSRGVLLVVSRAALADAQRAGRLADAVDASVRLP